MPTLLVNGRIFTGDGFATDLCVLIDGSRILAVTPDRTTSERAMSDDAVVEYDLRGRMLLPGFIDTQVNGGGGVLFNDAPNVESIRRIGHAHRRFGTTGFLPTLISADLIDIERAIAAVQDALDAEVPGVLGIHIEGPFINPTRKGVHDAARLRPLDQRAVELLTSLQGGRTMVTLAPEMASPDLIKRLVLAGVIVSAGHTDATYAQCRAALESGVTGFTHLFNAMSALTSREPGAVGAALEDSNAWCGVIVDGQHVSAAALRIALRCKSDAKLMLVTDAMPTVGTEVTSFDLQGRTISVSGEACRDADGRLAGSNLDMAGSVRNAISLLGITVGAAVRMATRNPARFLGFGHELGDIAPGYRANFAVADDELRVLETWIDGRPLAQGD